MRPIRLSLAALAALTLSVAAQAGPPKSKSEPSPPLLTNVHAHNDYEHTRPLLDALDHGICSVEADVYLEGGKLLVAHEKKDVKPERTLQALYLDPLKERSNKLGGHIYPTFGEFTLLIDIKGDAEKTYKALKEAFKAYPGLFTEFGEKPRKRAVTVILSGNRPTKTLAAEKQRLAALDGRVSDLKPKSAKDLMPKDVAPLVSDSWAPMFKWKGEGAMPEAERKKLKETVDLAHQQGRRVRFWAAPDKPEVWGEELDAGVDFLSVDDLDGVKKFVLARPKPAK